MYNYNKLFYLIFQPIIEIKNNKQLDVSEYEVLLRAYDDNRFPDKEFNKILMETKQHELFMTWYAEKINAVLLAHKNIYLAINIHPLQWGSPIIFDFFNKLKHFSSKIKIELTEHSEPVTDNIGEKFELIYHHLAGLGYNFVIDDVGSGVNDIDFVIEHIDKVSSIKFSTLPFRQLKQETLLLFIDAWFQLAKDFNKEFVVEGIECEKFSLLLLDKGIKLQQGFLFGEGKSILVPSDKN